MTREKYSLSFKLTWNKKAIFACLSSRNTIPRPRDWLSQFKTPLRTLDALHLAIAAGHDLPIITADEKLAVCANILEVKANLIA